MRALTVAKTAPKRELTVFAAWCDVFHAGERPVALRLGG
jgi:hypothetical protein